MEYELIEEGKVSILITPKVFYNKLARFSRSLGVPIVINEARSIGKQLVIADALAASGIRGLRYYVESEVIDRVFFNDRSKDACEAIIKNIRLNKCDNCEVYKFDANLFLNLFGESFYDLVEIDPFGTPSPFFDSAIISVKNRGVAAFTATDLTALCGIYPKSGFRKYGVLVQRTFFCHEIALRILIYNVLLAAGRHMRIIHPILSHFTEQYARIYVRVEKGKLKYPFENVGFILYDSKNIRTINLLDYSKKISRFNGTLIGPLWVGPLHDYKFVENILEKEYFNMIGELRDISRAKKLFKLFLEECNMPPYYYDIHKLSKKLKIPSPPLSRIVGEIVSRGFKATRTHFSGHGLKSDIPLEKFLDVLSDLGKK